MIRINLIPVEERRAVEGLSQFIFGIFIVALVIAFLVTLIIIQNKKIHEVRAEAVRVEKRIKELEKVRKKVEEFKRKNKELEKRIQVIAQLEKNRVGPLYVMDSLSKSIPDKAWINNFNNKGSRASFSGIAANEFVIAEFMRSLQKSEHFRGINLGKITNKRVSGKTFKSFKMNVGLKFFKTPESEKKTDSTKNGKTEIITQEGSKIEVTVEPEKEIADDSVIEEKEPKSNEDKDKSNKEKKQATPSEKVGTDDGSNVIIF